jgi:uncharacterized protein YndB with AHSA1/START domain
VSGALAETLQRAIEVSDRELSGRRRFAAPRELVWRMWTEPEHMVQWWGPNGFTATIREMNVTPGGRWDFVMHGPDGTDYDNRSVYLELVPPERLVYQHESPRFQATVTFVALSSGETEVTMRMLFDSAEELEHSCKQYGAIEGMAQHLARLDGYLARPR